MRGTHDHRVRSPRKKAAVAMNIYDTWFLGYVCGTVATICGVYLFMKEPK